MNLFKRAIRIFLAVTAVVSSIVVAAAIYFSRRILQPPKRPLWASPDDLGMDFNEVHFAAKEDAVHLSGWFIPANGAGDRPQATVMMIHGWPWHRLGEMADTIDARVLGTEDVDLLRMAHGLHHAGYHVLMFDMRNHGRSADTGGVSYGYNEANDVLGAVEYLQTRADVDVNRIGALGFSMGGNAVMYALARTDAIRSAVLVQPTTPSYFAGRITRDLAGPLGRLIAPLADLFVRLQDGVSMTAVDPRFIAPHTGPVPLLFVQGTGDTWGSVENVRQMADRAPGTIDSIAVNTTGRYGGYRYVIQNPALVTSFFDDYLV